MMRATWQASICAICSPSIASSRNAGVVPRDDAGVVLAVDAFFRLGPPGD
jgi:hypothetical protein